MDKNFIDSRSIAIPLAGYEKQEKSTIHDVNDDHLFVGRKKLIAKLSDLLKNNFNRGSYLIAGYRGSGKTYLIEKVLNDFRKDNEKVLVIHVNLGDNSQLTPLTIYYSIANILRDEILSNINNVRVNTSSSANAKLIAFFNTLFNPIVRIKNIVLGATIFFSFLIPISLYFAGDNNQKYEQILEWIQYSLMFMMPISAVLWVIGVLRHPIFSSLTKINHLLEGMSNEISENQNATINFWSNLGFVKQKKRLPINSREAEDKLIRILKQIRNDGYKVVLVLDEIDKLSNSEEFSYFHKEHGNIVKEPTDKNKIINTLLGSIKNFVTTAPAIFFFISGRETLDRYYSEKGSPNSLYGSLFDQVFEVPSFLSDKGASSGKNIQLYAAIEEYLCRRIRKKTGLQLDKDLDDYYSLRGYNLEFNQSNEMPMIRRVISILNSFVLYLTYHSWGNIKKINSIFESFQVPHKLALKLEKSGDLDLFDPLHKYKTEKSDVTHWLVFDIKQLRSFFLSSELMVLFQHHLSREISQISDKLIVSTLFSLHFILKLHSFGFSRETLHLMSESINVHRSPELNTIVDDLLTNIFRSYLRRVRNGLFRYRFHVGFEKELKFISHIGGLESAAFNFSPDSMKYVKSFFEDIIVNTNAEEKQLISRSHISLGDMCTIEQSYNTAYVHYNAASRILSNLVTEEGSQVKHSTLMLCIETLLKYGDLEERRQNYNHAASIYSEAEHIVQSVSANIDLKLHLQQGDSKWDLLKLPFWALKFLSLKRSPPPYKPYIRHAEQNYKLPDYLYRSNDSRYYYRLANLHYYQGDAQLAIDSYNTALAHSGSKNQNQNQNQNQFSDFDERTGYINGNSRVGIVESVWLHMAHYFFEGIIKKQSDLSKEIVELEREGKDTKEKRKISLEETKKEFFTNIFDLIYDSKKHNNEIGSLNVSFFDVFNDVADNFEKNRLYISAAITHIKSICYLSSILDLFDNDLLNLYLKDNNNVNKSQITNFLNKIYENATISTASAIKCIDKARQLESNQGNKSMMIYGMIDSSKKDEFSFSISNLFERLLKNNGPDNPLLEESILWQHSFWAHKLAASLYWLEYVKRKIDQSSNSCFDEKSNIILPLDLSSVSVESAITMRWVEARSICRSTIDKKLITAVHYKGNNKVRTKKFVSSDDIYGSIISNKSDIQFKLENPATEFIEYAKSMFSGYFKFEGDPPKIIVNACKVSRRLYLAQESSRIISRKNLDLIFPRVPQLYLAQWKLLTNLIPLISLRYLEITAKHPNSVRDISYLLQRILYTADQRLAPYEKIPPSHFDYEHIFTRLIESLESSISLMDRNSRTRMGIFEHKYFCHDDHSDPEFRLEYTLAYMYAPIAKFLHTQVKETNRKFEDCFPTAIRQYVKSN